MHRTDNVNSDVPHKLTDLSIDTSLLLLVAVGGFGAGLVLGFTVDYALCIKVFG